MASTKRVNLSVSQQSKDLTIAQIEQLKEQLVEKLQQYKNQNGKEYGLVILKVQSEDVKKDDYDYVNPQHYVQDDGKQTWEHMVDDKGSIVTGIFCDTNSYKYSDRKGKKPNEDEKREQSKIDWYDAKFDDLKKVVKENSDLEFKKLSKYLSEKFEIDIVVRKTNIWP